MDSRLRTLFAPKWVKLRELREHGYAQLHGENVDRRCLEPLPVGDLVQVQNQQGSQPTRWDRTGMVAETLGDRQYSVKMHGSGWLTLRNRRFLRKIQSLNPASHHPVNYTTVYQRDVPLLHPSGPSGAAAPPVSSAASPPTPVPVKPAAIHGPVPASAAKATTRAPWAASLAPPSVIPPASTDPGQPPIQLHTRPSVQPDPPRRSSRTRVPTRRLSMTPQGQSYT